jgi:hypothetical protein
MDFFSKNSLPDKETPVKECYLFYDLDHLDSEKKI